MAEWAYACHSCEDDPPSSWYASVAQLDELPAGTRIVRIKVGSQWRCATVDRARRVAVEHMLIRLAIASSEADCPVCREHLAETERSVPDIGAQPHPPSRTVQAAAISLQGKRLAVVVVSMDLLRGGGGEADLAISTLAPAFGGVPIVLMAQEENGSPRYHGDAGLIDLVAGIPLERLPWKEYPVA
jgi:hypothetical protein